MALSSKFSGRFGNRTMKEKLEGFYRGSERVSGGRYGCPTNLGCSKGTSISKGVWWMLETESFEGASKLG